MAKSKKVKDPITNGWVETSIAHVRLDKCKHIYDRNKTPIQSFEQIKRSLLDTQAYYDLTEKKRARAIVIISNSLIVVV